MNVKLLEQVREMVLRYPEHVDMDSFSKGVLVADKGMAPACGTVACIAGWAVALTDGVVSPLSATGILSRKYLDLESEEGTMLFYTINWPPKFHCEYRRAETPAARAQTVADRITHFIETGE